MILQVREHDCILIIVLSLIIWINRKSHIFLAMLYNLFGLIWLCSWVGIRFFVMIELRLLQIWADWNIFQVWEDLRQSHGFSILYLFKLIIPGLRLNLRLLLTAVLRSKVYFFILTLHRVEGHKLIFIGRTANEFIVLNVYHLTIRWAFDTLPKFENTSLLALMLNGWIILLILV